MLLKFLLVIKDSSNDSNKIITNNQHEVTNISDAYPQPLLNPIPPQTHKNRQSASKQKCFTTKQHWNFKCEVRDATVYCTYIYVYIGTWDHEGNSTTSSREVRYTGPIYCINELMALQQSLFRRIEKTQTSQPPNFIAPLINILLRFF